MKNCPKCEKKVIPVEDIVYDLDGNNFIVKGKRCTNCGEEFIDEQELQRIVDIAKKLGLWGGLKLKRKLSKSGRGTVLRIPSDIEQNMHLKGNEEVAISKVGKRKILIEIN